MFSTECRRFFSRPTCRFYKWYNSKISLIFLCLAGFFSRSARFCYSAVITSNHEFQLAWIMLTEKNRHQQHLNVRRACTFGVSVRFFSSVGTQFLFILFSIDSITNHWLTLANESEKIWNDVAKLAEACAHTIPNEKRCWITCLCMNDSVYGKKYDNECMDVNRILIFPYISIAHFFRFLSLPVYRHRSNIEQYLCIKCNPIFPEYRNKTWSKMIHLLSGRNWKRRQSCLSTNDN